MSPQYDDDLDPIVAFRVALARFETKLDLVIDEQTHRINDHESRLRVLEATHTVTPKGMAYAIGTVITVLIALMALFDLFLDHL